MAGQVVLAQGEARRLVHRAVGQAADARRGAGTQLRAERRRTLPRSLGRRGDHRHGSSSPCLAPVDRQCLSSRADHCDHLLRRRGWHREACPISRRRRNGIVSPCSRASRSGAARVAWLAAAVFGGRAVGAAVADRSTAVQVVGTVGAWVGWAVGAIALAVPSVATLTVVRAVVPAALAVTVATVVFGADADDVLALGLPALLASRPGGGGRDRTDLPPGLGVRRRTALRPAAAARLPHGDRADVARLGHRRDHRAAGVGGAGVVAGGRRDVARASPRP